MNWDYIAGFFDGEGSVIFRKNDVRLQFPNNNEESLKEIHKFLKCGNIKFYHRNPDRWQPQGVLMIGSYKNVYPILKKLKNKCIIKKEKIEKAIKYYDTKEWHFIEVDMKKLNNLRNNGFSIREIAKEMKLNRGTVHNRLGYKRK